MRIDRLKAVWTKGWPGVLLAGLFGFMLLWLPFTDGIVALSYDLPFFFRHNIPLEGVTIIYMDQDSHEKLGQKWHERWDRSLHARLIDNLTRWHAKAVAFDVLFSGASDPAADAEFVRAARANGRVVLASKLGPDVHEGELIGWRLEKPFPPFQGAALSGIVEESAIGRMIRQHYYRPSYPDPSMAWQTAKLAMTNPPPPLADRWVNYYGPPEWIEHISYFEALQTNFDGVAAFSNKVVFVGAQYDVGFTGGRGTDDFRTPYTLWTGRKSPGVEINATTFLNLTRGDWLVRLSPWTETALILMFGAIMGLGLAACRPMSATIYAVVAAVAVATGATALVWHTKIWVPWLIGAAVQIPMALGWSVLAHTRILHREKRSLEQALAMAQRGEVVVAAPVLSPVAGSGAHGEANPFFRKPGSSDQLGTLGIDDRPRPVIADHELLRCIGGGAYGKVWLARDIIGTFHAVKVVYRDNFKDARPLEREFNGLKRFTPISRSHPGFVNVLHVGRNDEQAYIYYVMELGDDEVTGQKIDPETYSPKTLANELRQRKMLPLPECLEVMIHLADALDYLHRQHLIHRDIKPSNLIFVNGVCKFADIGLVTDMATDGHDVTYLGTPGRIAPEGPGAPTSDVYSLGKVLYEVAFGLDLERFPELPSSVVEGTVSEGLLQLNRIIMKACENDLRRRYQSAAEFRAALLALQTKLASPAKV